MISLAIKKNLTDKEPLGIVIIAAGDSSRLGRIKQLIEFNGLSLLQRTINMANGLNQPVVCVLGYNANEIKSQIQAQATTILNNHQWQQGMGSSIALGVNFLSEICDAVLILLCDQYLLTQADIEKLILLWKKNKNKKIIASQYWDKKSKQLIQGAPSLFPGKFFSDLLSLTDKGARNILKNKQQHVLSVLLENAAYDLDTKTDLQYLHRLTQS